MDNMDLSPYCGSFLSNDVSDVSLMSSSVFSPTDHLYNTSINFDF